MNYCIYYQSVTVVWCIWGETSHTAMRYNAIPVVCPKNTTVGGGARNHLYRGKSPEPLFL